MCLFPAALSHRPPPSNTSDCLSPSMGGTPRGASSGSGRLRRRPCRRDTGIAEACGREVVQRSAKMCKELVHNDSPQWRPPQHVPMPQGRERRDGWSAPVKDFLSPGRVPHTHPPREEGGSGGGDIFGVKKFLGFCADKMAEIPPLARSPQGPCPTIKKKTCLR